MSKSLKWRTLLTLAILAVAALFLVPSVVPSLPSWWTTVFPSDKLRLGLDLRGGMHLVLGVQLDKAIEGETERTAAELKNNLRRKRLVFSEVSRQGMTDIVVKLAPSSKAADIKEQFKELLVFDIASENSDEIVLRMQSAEVTRIRGMAIDQGRETIQNRVDAFGVSEAAIIKQGDDQIVVELPGVKDSKRAIQLIGKTALLEFKLLNEEASVDAALKGNVPPGSEILYQRDVDAATGQVVKTPYLVKTQTLMTGSRIRDAKVEIDTQYNKPYVAMEFDGVGARMFGDITGENVRKRLAIVLDGTVYSAPVIQEKIPEGRARITGQFTMEEARDLAIVLRAGALPAPVEILENRTVGPSLGADLVRKGFLASIVGSLLVILFMIVYYRWSGMVANLALVINLFLLLAALAGFKAALTLPGIAGLALTIGMAVDANVLINERIREEMRAGRGIGAAVTNGYARAFTTIMDSNLTTLITALVLWAVGTGPVRGFAVTLTLGLLANLFTAIFVTRIVFDYFVYERKITRLSI
jgi:preprotein translocase subunit SecD